MGGLLRLQDRDSMVALLAADPPHWHKSHALPQCLEHNDVDTVRLLLDAGADPNWGRLLAAIGRAGLEGLGLVLLVLGFALLKGHLVADWFMGLRGVRGLWRWVVVIWLLIPGGLITLAFVWSYRG